MSKLEELTEDFGVTLKHMAEQSYKPMTNGDRIRSKRNDELAEFIADVVESLIIFECAKTRCNITATQIRAIKHTWFCSLYGWLKQPAEVET